MAEPSDAALPAGPGGHQSQDWQAGVRPGGPGNGQAGARSGGPGNRQAGAHPGGLPLLAGLAIVLAGTALLGVAAGFVWLAVAPRAIIVVVGRGSADVVNPETSAFIAADGWFTLVSVVGGIISGLLGYLLAVQRHGPLAMAGVLAGAVAAALIARWIGQQPGQAAVTHSLALGRPGTLLQEPLALGGIGALAFWPLTAALVAGGMEAAALLRAHRSRPPAGYGLAVPGQLPPAVGAQFPPGVPGQLPPAVGAQFPSAVPGQLPPGSPGGRSPDQPQPGPPEPRG